MRDKLLLCCCFAIFFICSSIFAEVVCLNNGNKVTGLIVSQDEDKVVVSIGEGEDATEVTFFNDEIKSIEEESNDQANEPQDSSVLIIDKKVEITQPIQVPPAQLTQAAEIKAEPLAMTDEATTVEADTESAQLQNQLQNLAQSSQPPLQQEGPSPEQQVLEELTLLLDAEELAYFAKINSMAGEVVNKTMQILNNPTSLASDPTQLPQMMQDISSDIANIATQMNSIQAPPMFVDFHKDYLTNLNLLKDVLAGMSKGDVAASQGKITQLQSMNMKLQEDLKAILQKKKSNIQSQGGKADASN
jgi:hypothetical protein